MNKGFVVAAAMLASGGAFAADDPIDRDPGLYGARATYTLQFGGNAQPLRHSAGLHLAGGSSVPAVEYRWSAGNGELRLRGNSVMFRATDDDDEEPKAIWGLTGKQWVYILTATGIVVAILIIPSLDSDPVGGTGISP